jgi:hypothetical protein
VRQRFDGGELRGLGIEDVAGDDVAHRDLKRDRQGADSKRGEEAEAVVSVPASAQHPDGVHPCHGEPGHDVRREQHVDRLVPEGVVEEDLPDIDVHHLAVADGDAAG